MTEDLIPLPGYVVVELTDSMLANIEIPDKPYSTKTSGVVVAVPNTGDRKLDKAEAAFIGLKVHFEAYKDDTKVMRDEREFAFIKVEDIRGYESAKAKS